MAIKFLSNVLGSGELEGITIEATDKITIGGSSDTALTISQGDILLGGAAGTAGQVLTSNGENNSTSWTNKTVNTNNYVTSATFNSQGNGILTLNRTGLSSVTVDLDGRYAEKVTGGYLPLSGGTMTGQLKILTITSVSATSAIGTSSSPIVNIFAESLTASQMSGTLSGTLASSVVGTTQSLDDGSTKIATTAYVDGMIGTVTDSNTTYQLTTTPTGTGIRLDPSSGLNNDISFTGSGNGITITRNSPTALTFTSSPTLADVMTNGSTTTSAITVGTITNNGSITTTTSATVGTTLLVLGNSTLTSLDVGGGYGSTGVTISATGNISANGTLVIGGTATFDSDITLNANHTLKSSSNPTSNYLDFDDDSQTHGPDSNVTTLGSVSGVAIATNLNDGGGGTFTISTGTAGTRMLTIATDGDATFNGTIDTGANSISTTGTVNAGTFSGDLNGTINTATTATTQAASNNSTKVATTAYVDAAIGTIPAGLVFQGSWNADTNSPTLTSGSGTTGHFYIVSVAGSTNLDGITDWQVGDWAVFVEQGASDQWEKIDNSSTLGGAGTSGKIAKWSGTTSLDDSTISDNGTDITMSGDLTVSGGEFTLGTSATTSIGKNLLKVPNISAVRFIRLNADESVSTLSAADFRTAIGAGTSSTTGTVTGVTGTSPINSDGSSSSPAISIDTADTNTTGALTSTDWNTFNNKTSNTGTVTATNGSANEIAVFSSATNIDGDANLKYGTVANQLQLVDGTSTIRIGSNTPGYLDIGKNSITHTDGSPSAVFSISSDRGIRVNVPANTISSYSLFTPTDVLTYKLDTTTNAIKHFFKFDVDFSSGGTVDLNGTTNAVTQTTGDDSTKVATTEYVMNTAVTGSGAAGRIPYFSSSQAITTESALEYNATDNRLELVGQVDFRTTATATTGIIYEEAPAQDKVSGDIVFLGTAGTVQAGRAYILQSNGTWIGVTDNNEARASGMVALAIGTNVTDGMLLRGFAKFQGGTGYSNYAGITGTVGAKVYVGNSSTHSGAGNMTNTLNVSSNQFVRILGYAVSSNVIYFNPDQSYIQNG